MKKKVKKYGHTLVIQFNSQEQEIYKINEGNIYDITLEEVKK